MEAAFTEAFAAQPRSHWEQVFGGTDACVSPVLSMREAMVHPANSGRGMFLDHNGVLQAAPAPRFSVTPGTIRASEATTVERLLSEWGAP
jgi:alpha-methylacyl-CoA racemase